MNLHDQAIQVIAQKMGGVDNHHNPQYRLVGAWGESSFVPDVIEFNGSQQVSAIHEVEVAHTKMSSEYLAALKEALRWNVHGLGKPHRPFTTLWIVVGNYKQMAKVFDRVEFLVAPPTKLAQEVLKHLRDMQEGRKKSD